MTFQPGDRVRWDTTGGAGFPLIRYGFVGASEHPNGRAIVMLDGELKGDMVIPASELQLVSITNVELHLAGDDLLHDPSLRRGLVNLWTAEADKAGLEVDALSFLDNGSALAELQSGGQSFLLSSSPLTGDEETFSVKATPS